MPEATRFFTEQGIPLTIALGIVGILGAGWLIRGVVAAPAGNDRMIQIARAIQEGARAYLRRQIATISVIAALLVILLWVAKGSPAVPVGFVVGSVFSMLAGYIGMRVAILANVRTAHAASLSRHQALSVAFNGGAVTGLLVAGLGLLSVGVYFLLATHWLGGTNQAIHSLVGLALGASLISVFARLGGGIYTKAADVGADLVGKIESKLDEDDPRNPATIADNVGDNVGDCAGMAADVFETYAVSLIGAILLGHLIAPDHPAALVYPFLLGGVAIIGSVLGVVFVNLRRGNPTATLLGGVTVGLVLSAALFWPLTSTLFPSGLTTAGGTVVRSDALYLCTLVGLVMTGLVCAITNYYTSTHHRPVRKIAEASETGHATNIITGLAVGKEATALPVLAIVAAIAASYQLGGLYGIAVAVMAMLSMAGLIVSLDAFGPITDNAGGIAAMSELPPEVRQITDELDAVGNTMKAVTKGYAIASAGLAALVLFGSYVEELRAHYLASGRPFDIVFSLEDPRVLIGMFLGGLLPFLFSSWSMRAVGKAAGAVVNEVRRQLRLHPGILRGEDTPEYGACVDIVTKAALREMIVPSLLPVGAVVAVAAVPALGPVALGGVLAGTILTGLFVGLSMTSAGGAWDNAKKYIEDGHHGGKGSPAHAASVTGDTVGDPYKDTSGPAINPMIKVVNIVAILIIPIFFN